MSTPRTIGATNVAPLTVRAEARTIRSVEYQRFRVLEMALRAFSRTVKKAILDEYTSNNKNNEVALLRFFTT